MERPSVQRLREEIKQTKPFVDPYHALTLAMVRTLDFVRKGHSQLVAAQGISPEQYNVLRILRGAGEAGLPTLEIATRLLEENPGITRLIDKLETKQLVRRVRCEHDRRQVFCYITPSGLELVESLDEPAQRISHENFRGLRLEEVDHLIDLLDRIRYPQP